MTTKKEQPRKPREFNPPMLGDFEDEEARLDKAWAKIARQKRAIETAQRGDQSAKRKD